MLRDDLDHAIGLAQFLTPLNRLHFDDDFWRHLFQKGSRGELMLQQSGKVPDTYVDEVLENLAWNSYFPKEVLDNLEGGRLDVKVFPDDFIEFLERDYIGKGQVPSFSEADYKEATHSEDFEEILEKRILAIDAYGKRVCEAILEAITDPLFEEQGYGFSGEYIAKLARRRAFDKISKKHLGQQ